jgi:hypothetical protein
MGFFFPFFFSNWKGEEGGVRDFYQPSTLFLFLFSFFSCIIQNGVLVGAGSLQPHERPSSETFRNSVLLPAYEHGPTQRTGPLRVYVIYRKHMHALLIVMIITNGSP